MTTESARRYARWGRSGRTASFWVAAHLLGCSTASRNLDSADASASAVDAAPGDTSDGPPNSNPCIDCPESADLVPEVCGDDWRQPACAGETDDTCRVLEIDIEGETRTALVSRSGGYDCSSGDLPLVLFFHGSGGNGASDRAQVNATWADLDLETAIGGEALVVYPDGKPHRDCFCRTCWNRDSDGSDFAFFDALLLRLEAEYCIDLDRVFAIGHSRGGRFVEALACGRTSALRAIAMIGAGTNNVTACSGRMPAWLSHGIDDATIPFAEGEANLRSWAQRNGCSAPLPSYPVDACTPLAGCPTTAPVTWCPTTETDWQGHAVPGLADEAIWPFFVAAGAR